MDYTDRNEQEEDWLEEDVGGYADVDDRPKAKIEKIFAERAEAITAFLAIVLTIVRIGTGAVLGAM